MNNNTYKEKEKNFKKNRYANLTIDTIRVLAAEMVHAAQSGHSGMALGAAPIMYALFKDHLVFNPKKKFPNRDRFVLSAGHGSALLYATLHLAGCNISVHDLKNFRKINSKTAGHPENVLIDEIEATTGPLGQGIGIATGMAIAETRLAAYFKKNRLFNYYTYCLFGDGCFEEGVSYEAFSIAAKLKLHKLIFIYDSNNVQLEGYTSDNTITNKQLYFEALGLNYLFVADGNDYNAISEAIFKAKECKDKPTVIEVKTIIGYASCFENTPKAHGGIFNNEQLVQLKTNLSYFNENFEISKNAYYEFAALAKRGEKANQLFDKKVETLKATDKDKFKVYTNFLNHTIEFNKKWFSEYKKDKDATRNISHFVLSKICENNPLITMLSPDLSSSTKINYPDGGIYSFENPLGRNINIGVREFGMVDLEIGMALSGLKAIGATFLTFSDYCKGAIRLAALSKAPIVNVFSHDSFAVGEDGPTHQPIEQLWALRLIPNHTLFRVANLDEMVQAFQYAFNNNNKPVSIITCRQNINLFKSPNFIIKRGAYLVKKEKSNHINLLASGSEVSLAIAVKDYLAQKYNVIANVISVVSFELFLKEPKAYKDTVINDKFSISIEFGNTYAWSKLVRFAIGINHFGACGSYNDLAKKYKLNVESVAETIHEYLITHKNIT